MYCNRMDNIIDKKFPVVEVNDYLTCHLCKGYLIDATTISECLHSFCRSCIIKFLEENSYCPICEVIINKAKPNLKPDKTLQDIVYKVVPELFLKEMQRRRIFYSKYPEVASKLTPEQRGEDTERTIFNPQDVISLSIEFMRTDSIPGVIKINGLRNSSGDSQTASELKRYLQCSGMCRVEVIKKFIQKKYSVDTDLYYIDLLYKKHMSLLDHYTLIDVAYIGMWKRNEPMNLYFQILDLQEVKKRTEQFEINTNLIATIKRPVRVKNNKSPRGPKTSTPKVKRNFSKKLFRSNKTDDSVETSASNIDIENTRTDDNIATKVDEAVVNVNNTTAKSEDVKLETNKTDIEKDCDKTEPTNTEPVPEIKTPENSQKAQNNEPDPNQKVITNITLNRTNNLEIITKMRKVSTKDGQSAVDIINQTVKKVPVTNVIIKTDAPAKEETEEVKKTPQELEEEEKFKFLKSIELTSKNVVLDLAKQQQKAPPQQMAILKSSSLKMTLAKVSPKGTKRKNSSPIKNDKIKKLKIEKKGTTKIILQSKPLEPTVNQIINNVNSSASSLSKIVDNNQNSDLKQLFNNCKINIPSSLSITLKENKGEVEKTPQIPPVQNYIQILKIPEEAKKEPLNDKATKTNKTRIVLQAVPTSEPSKATTSVRNAQNSFQKIFEESIKKAENEKGSETIPTSGKRNILEIASQLSKRSKSEQEKQDGSKTEDVLPKIPIPRLTTQRVLKPIQKSDNHPPQTFANMHSASLGMNYTVSVSQNPQNEIPKINGAISSPDQINIKVSIGQASPTCATVFCKAPIKSPKPPDKNLSPKSSESKALSPKIKCSPIRTLSMPNEKDSSQKLSPKPTTSTPLTPHATNTTKTSQGGKVPVSTYTTSSMNSSQLLEKYNIQTLSQLAANFNINAAASYAMGHASPQLAAFQQAMMLKHLELAQNRQKWLNMSQGPLLQYEKYLQSLNSTQNHLLGNIKEN